MVAEIETAYYAETVDAGWAVSATADIRRALNGASKPGVTVDALDCRATACRLVVTCPSQEAFLELFTALFIGPTAQINMGNVLVGPKSTSARGSSVTVLIARAGHPLPGERR